MREISEFESKANFRALLDLVEQAPDKLNRSIRVVCGTSRAIAARHGTASAYRHADRGRRAALTSH